jgi:phosphate starvation-inducible PhoH-like protein
MFTEPRASKAEARATRRAERQQRRPTNTPKPLHAKNERQRILIEALRAGESAFAVGSAGTGKTYIPARIAARKLADGQVDKIIIARATVSKPKHALGFLPGKIDAKMRPWLQPVIDGLRAEVSAAQLEQWTQEGKFEIASFEHMRGRTFERAFVILDEAQNCDFGDLRLLLTRIGEHTQVVITGDLDQIDIPDSGLLPVLDMVERYHLPMHVIQFTETEVVRSAFAREFVKAFAKLTPKVANLDAVDPFTENARTTRKVA